MNKTEEKNPRERLIETALDLFYTQGYLATGINQIIAEANVAKATFYVHFPSKEVLCVAYLQARHHIWMGWLKQGVAKQKTAGEKLTGVFDFLAEWMTKSRFRGCAFLNIATEIPSLDTQIRAEVIHHKNDLRDYLKQIIDAFAESGGAFAGMNTQQMSRQVYVLVEGAIVASQNYGEIWPIEAARDTVRDLFGLSSFRSINQ